MLVCSAVKFKIDKTNEEVILCGVRHGDVYKQLMDLGFEPRVGYTELEDGFLDNTGRFFNRHDAMIYAIASGQASEESISKYNEGKQNYLYSEDLW